MPLYEYECKNCGERFELWRAVHEAEKKLECPRCGTQQVKRVFSSFNSAGDCSRTATPRSYGFG